MAIRDPHLVAAGIVRDAGGEIVGRTRFQKVAYLMQLAGLFNNLRFEYHHYGPFSEDIAAGIEIASALGTLNEVQRQAGWGGRYSVYTLPQPAQPANPERAVFVQLAAHIGAIELELAATAAFLYAVEGIGRTQPGNPWDETRARKPEKAAGGRLEQARSAYAKLRAVPTPRPLPALQ